MTLHFIAQATTSTTNFSSPTINVLRRDIVNDAKN